MRRDPLEYKQTAMMLLEEALGLLRGNTRNQGRRQEVPLNRALWFCFMRAAHSGGYRFRHHLPVPEGCNPPHASDEERARREDKRPDFYWQFMDHLADDVSCCDRRFVLECKRLGSPSRRTWVLNENYINNGVSRFITQEHGYGKGDEAGGMIGYVQDMDFNDILREVNTLTRAFPGQSYELQHFWVDLRSASTRVGRHP